MAIRVAARYDDLGRGKGYLRKSADATYHAGQSGVDAEVYNAAEILIDTIKANLSSITPSNREEAHNVAAVRDNIKAADAGKTFMRRRFAKGSEIRVALVTTEGAGAYAPSMVEFGRGGFPGAYPMTKALFEMGGST